MTQYIIRRLLQSVLVVVGVSFLVFVIMFQTGDPVILMASPDATREEVEELRRALGFDRPWYVQYGDFIWNAVRGDFGTSLRHGQPVFSLIWERIPATLELALAAFAFSVCLSIPIGIISATMRNSIWDNAVMAFALFGQALPVFFLGIMLIWIFAGIFHIFPSGGRGDLSHLILPAITLGTFSLARNSRLVRSSLLEVLSQDYVKTARSKGLAERVVILRHALRNALIPVVTVLGLEFGVLLGGAVITETVFAWPGIGLALSQAITQRDTVLLQGGILLIAVIFVLINFLVDVLYAYFNPKIKLS